MQLYSFQIVNLIGVIFCFKIFPGTLEYGKTASRHWNDLQCVEDWIQPSMM